jgi:cytochrome c-type biogenesis protein CcmH
MSGFIFLAGLLTLAVLVALLYPLLRRREGSPEAWRSAGLAGMVIALGAAALYPLWSNFKWNEPAPALDSPAAMVGRLARRLEKQPDDLQGWLLLGKSYGVIEQFSLSARAYQRADSLAQGQSAEAAIGLAEALVNGGRSDLAGRAGRLFEQALALDGNSVKALFYSAIAAMERQEFPLAKERFTRLLDGNPPEQVRQVIQEQIQALDAMSVMAAQAAPATGARPAAATAQPAAPAAAAVSVPLRITLSKSVAAQAAAGAPLFVLARVPGQRGPPLAAKRLEAKFPLEVELLSTDAMMAGSGFTAGQEIEVEARIANGGGAISRTGDPFGTVRVKAGSGGRTALEISQLKP